MFWSLIFAAAAGQLRPLLQLCCRLKGPLPEYCADHSGEFFNINPDSTSLRLQYMSSCSFFSFFNFVFHVDHTVFFLFVQVSAVISIPLWQWFLQRFGKKTATFCGVSVSAGRYHGLWCHLVLKTINNPTKHECFCLSVHSGSCPSPCCWSLSLMWWWATLLLSPLDWVWLHHSCCHGKTKHFD